MKKPQSASTKKDTSKASSVKHDIRNALAVISLSAEIAAQESKDAKTHLNNILAQTKKLQNLLKKI